MAQQECCFFKGVDTGFACRRTDALQVVRANMNLGPGELLPIAQVLCHEESDSERANDCPAFAQMQAIRDQSPFARRLAK